MMQIRIYVFCVYLGIEISRSAEGNVLKCGRGHIAAENDHYEDATEAKRGNWPWMVKLQHNGAYLCGGSIYHPEFILTSAHCLEYLHGDISNVDAVLGAHTLFEDTPEQVLTVKIKKIFDHPFYNNKTFKNDIAIAQLEEQVDFETNKTIRPVCLPTHRPHKDSIVYVTGWGTTRPFDKAGHEQAHPNHPLKNALQQAKVKVVVDRDYCKFDEKLEYFPSGFCTSFAESGHHQCVGDSGSPVMFIEQKGTPWYQLGIVSYSEEDCGGKRHPAVNTVLSDYVAWIAQVMNFTTGRIFDMNPYPSLLK